ncbi:uncharacterized protein LOC129229263 [Uloborus diversus]|uniref:uncharacterized protein LOC129229263 n=1 Tax=Uloborus diversus TaxID=327109 RepID=UPI0024096DA9|nr:uncharacterized protein LOC129229263 [Uloborus diversus]
MESQLTELQEQQHQSLLQELESHKKTNQELLDKIDELTLEMENIHQNSLVESSASPGVRRTHSWLSDYKKESSTAGNKRRGSGSSSDDMSDDESPTIGKLRKTFFSEGKLTPELDFEEACNKKSSRKGNQPSSLEILVKDMMINQSCLMKKLQVSEEKQLMFERLYKRSENKNKMLNSLIRDMSTAMA